MIRALIMWLIWNAVWEVRVINTASGKDLPGEKKFSGGYWKARKFFKNHEPKPGQLMRLQTRSVSAFKARIPPQPVAEQMSEVQTAVNDITNKRLDSVAMTASPTPVADVPHGTLDPGTEDLVASGGLPEAHLHDSTGPLDWNEGYGGYVATCSVCGQHMIDEAPEVAP